METNKLLISKVGNNLECEEWTSVVEVYQPLIASWLTRFGGAPQEIADITQDVLCIVVRELPKFVHNGRTGAFRTWLRTITVNRLRQHWKQESQRKVVNAELNDQVLEMLANPASEISRRWNLEHDQHVLDRVLDRVSLEFDAKTMNAFRKFVLDGQDSRLVARELGVSAGQIYKYKFRVMKRLRSLVQSLREQGLDSIFSSVVDEMSRSGATADLLSA